MCDGDQLRDTESDNINTIVSYDHDPEDAIALVNIIVYMYKI